MIAAELITIIPALYLRKILVIFFTQDAYLALRKANIWSKNARIKHGIFIKVVQRRLRFEFFYRQNTCHKG